MSSTARYYVLRGRLLLRRASHAVIGWAALLLMRVARLFNRRRTANLFGAMLRRIGPWLPEQRVGRANLAAAFPQKSAAEIDAMLGDVWDNLGRVAAEFSHLDRFTFPRPDRAGDVDIVYDEASTERRKAIQAAPGPRAFFAAHLANWELPALIAHDLGIDASILYRPPSVRTVSEAVLKIRSGCMGTLVPSGYGAPVQLARVLEGGGKVGMLVDQNESRGVEVTFFGRRCKASPLLAQLARHFDCPIHGLRVVRLPDRNRFWAELTAPIEPVRDAQGLIDIAGTTQTITAVVEGWVREHPEQWLWLHRRWR